MLYCTGGIRCERASALLNQMVESDPSFNVRETVQVRGGIERYLKTFPEGGFWKGKNYLFDKRQEQKPELKSDDALEGEVESQCCVCERTWGVYRGRYKCGVRECGVPVIVCPRCVTSAKEQPGKLRCPLCVEGYKAPTLEPDLVGMKRRLGVTGVESAGAEQGNKRARVDERRQRIADAAADAAASDAEHAKVRARECECASECSRGRKRMQQRPRARADVPSLCALCGCRPSAGPVRRRSACTCAKSRW